MTNEKLHGLVTLPHRTWIGARYFLLLLFLLTSLLAGFGADTKTNADQAGTVAMTFINGYVKASRARTWNSEKWIASNPLVTENFRQARAKLIADGLKNDPEVGLDADPVINGNDCPERYTVKSAKASGDMASVVLIGSKDFPAQLKVRLVKSGGKWLVDASGMMLR
jgi:hypothetical protein